MKYCVNCGSELKDDQQVCLKCGTLTSELVNSEEKKANSGLTVAVKIFLIIGTISLGITIIPLLWCVPMTISYFKKVEKGEEISSGFKICCLLFVSMLAGILMLCDGEN